MIQNLSFSGKEDENPYLHIRDFEQACDCLRITTRIGALHDDGFGHRLPKIRHSQLSMTYEKSVMYLTSYICCTELSRHGFIFISVMDCMVWKHSKRVLWWSKTSWIWSTSAIGPNFLFKYDLNSNLNQHHMKIVTDHNQISSQITTYFHHRKGLENKRSGTDDQCHLHYMLIPSPEYRVSVTEKMARLTHVNAITLTSLNTFQTNINTFLGNLM
jgi:hypothetical protein